MEQAVRSPERLMLTDQQPGDHQRRGGLRGPGPRARSCDTCGVVMASTAHQGWRCGLHKTVADGPDPRKLPTMVKVQPAA